MVRPSILLRKDDEVHAFFLDEALGARVTIAELRAMDPKRTTHLPDGSRYVTEADFPDDPLPAGPVVPGPAYGLVA